MTCGRTIYCGYANLLATYLPPRLRASKRHRKLLSNAEPQSWKLRASSNAFVSSKRRKCSCFRANGRDQPSPVSRSRTLSLSLTTRLLEATASPAAGREPRRSEVYSLHRTKLRHSVDRSLGNPKKLCQNVLPIFFSVLKSSRKG